MTPGGPLELVARIVAMLDHLQIPYALGGSLAASFFGEPRSTMDIDVAIDVGVAVGDALIERAAVAFVVPTTSARDALRTHGSFNLLSAEGGMKVDLFVLGDDILDRRQIERRVRIPVPGFPDGLWVTSGPGAPQARLLPTGRVGLGSSVARRRRHTARARGGTRHRRSQGHGRSSRPRRPPGASDRRGRRIGLIRSGRAPGPPLSQLLDGYFWLATSPADMDWQDWSDGRGG